MLCDVIIHLCFYVYNNKTDGMRYVTVTSPSKLEIRPLSNAIFSAIYNESQQLATDS